jgi:hypothetical protein
MSNASSDITIGKKPDCLLKRGSTELFHVVSFRVHQIVAARIRILPGDSNSDRSLLIAVDELKAKMNPYGWTKNSVVTWTMAAQIGGEFDVVTGKILIFYQLHKELTAEQRILLLRGISDLFEVIPP